MIKPYFLTSLTAISLLLMSCDGQGSGQGSAGAPTSASSLGAEAMQRYCVDDFPDEATMKAKLRADGFQSGDDTRFANADETIIVIVMESPTGRGFGCSVLFDSPEDLTVVRDHIISGVDTRGQGVFSAWAAGYGIEDSLAIVNGQSYMTDAALAEYDDTEWQGFLMLYTEH